MSGDQPALDRISRILDPQARLAALQTYTLAALSTARVREEPEAFPLLDALRLVVASAGSVRRRLPTAEASTFLRAGLDPLYRGLSGFMFLRFAGLSPSGDGDLTAQKHLTDADLSDDDRELLDTYFALVQEMAHWKTSFYLHRRLCDDLHGLPAAEQEEFRRLCDSLAAMLRQQLHPPLPRDYRRTLGLQWDRTAELRTLAALTADDGPPADAAGIRRCDIAHGTAIGYFINMLPTSRPCYGVVAFERDRTHWWCSTVWSARVHPLKGRLSQIHFTFEDLDADLRSISGHGSSDLAMILDDRQPPLRRVAHVALQDHTACGLPLSCIFDPDSSYSTSNSAPPARWRPPPDGETTLTFWGDLDYGLGRQVWADDRSRTVMHAGSPILSYPTAPQDLPPFPGFPGTLPFASYERWFFEDLGREAGRRAILHHGANAGRDEFLETAAGEANVLHVSTHGEADAERPELSRLLLAGDGDGPTYVLLLDVLARDWSRYDLVFLNVCVSQAGRKTFGEESLSLGWAFLAGGARAVIACRWNVEDRVAWSFVRSFYHCWLNERPRPSIRAAFHHALRDVRNVHDFGRPSQWGAFVLLESSVAP